MKTFAFFLSFIFLLAEISGQTVNITVQTNAEKSPISPYLFGKNNVLPSTYLNDGSNDEVDKAREAGLKLVRQSGGNNSTKYNWRTKLSSHPDWYNNVYSNDWDAAAENLLNKLPGVQGMWSFQLLGKVAANNANNFNDWGYNRSQWWQGVHQNLAGGGVVNPVGSGKPLVEGNTNLYLTNWPADSTVAILNHWFGKDQLKYDPSFFKYWSMDNEPEIWSGTHDDVMKTQLPAEEFMQSYFKVAKAARLRFPDIKLVGPVPANEWQWYRWGNDGISWKGKKYCWLEYFILRIAEEEQASGVKLLDVLDIHYYPSSSDAAQVLQYHRVFFDKDYVYPEANGVKTVEGGWNDALNKEYIFGRCSEWLAKYKGANHGVSFGMTEYGINSSNANVQAVFYASLMGEFMKNKVEVLTPWSWAPGMWETAHLFARNAFEHYLPATSSADQIVSAYPTINGNEDSMVVFFVNRDLTSTRKINLSLDGFQSIEASTLLSLSALPSTETFVSRSQNALKTKTITHNGNAISFDLAPLSVNALVLKSQSTPIKDLNDFVGDIKLFPNPGFGLFTIGLPETFGSVSQVEVFNQMGQKVFELNGPPISANGELSIDLTNFSNGVYNLHICSDLFQATKSLVLIK